MPMLAARHYLLVYKEKSALGALQVLLSARGMCIRCTNERAFVLSSASSLGGEAGDRLVSTAAAARRHAAARGFAERLRRDVPESELAIFCSSPTARGEQADGRSMLTILSRLSCVCSGLPHPTACRRDQIR